MKKLTAFLVATAMLLSSGVTTPAQACPQPTDKLLTKEEQTVIADLTRYPTEQVEGVREYIALMNGVEGILAGILPSSEKVAALNALRPRAHATGKKLAGLSAKRMGELRIALGDKDDTRPMLTYGYIQRQKEGTDECFHKLFYLLGDLAHAPTDAAGERDILHRWLCGKPPRLCGRLERIDMAGSRFRLCIQPDNAEATQYIAIEFTLAGGQEVADALSAELTTSDKGNCHVLLRYNPDVLRCTNKGYELAGFCHRSNILHLRGTLLHDVLTSHPELQSNRLTLSVPVGSNN